MKRHCWDSSRSLQFSVAEFMSCEDKNDQERAASDIDIVLGAVVELSHDCGVRVYNRSFFEARAQKHSSVSWHHQASTSKSAGSQSFSSHNGHVVCRLVCYPRHVRVHASALALAPNHGYHRRCEGITPAFSHIARNANVHAGLVVPQDVVAE